jgi:Tol biopolymer transport system component
MPAFSPDGAEIAFVRSSSQRGISDIFIVRMAGGGERRVTFDNKTISGVAWASDKRLVITSNRGGANRLWAIPAAGGQPELISVPSRNLVRVSAGGTPRRLVVMEIHRTPDLWRVDLDRLSAPPERLMTTTRRNDSVKYSPDGKQIVFGSDRSGEYELWVANADGASARRITSFGGLPVGSPNWSPDGSRIVFDAVKDGRSVIYTVNAQGGPPQLFLQDAWDNMMPSWSKDGKFIYFACRRPEGLRMFKKPAGGGEPLQLTFQSGGDPVEAPGAALLYYSGGQDGVWQVPIQGGQEERVKGLEKIRHSRYFAATRRGLYFVGDNAAPTVQFFDFASRRITTLLKIDKRLLNGTPGLAVTPDDRWLLYCQVDDGGGDILMVSENR